MHQDIKIAYDYFLSLIEGTKSIVIAMRDHQTSDDKNNIATQIGLIEEMISNMEGLKEDLSDILKKSKGFSA
tara:strand:- start:22334 stop:22549 length:216 start_codon:yes stop_codon:yes gene_type:complete